MNTFFKFSLTILILLKSGIITHGVRLKIHPNGRHLIKFEGDTLTLTCLIDHEEDARAHESSSFLSIPPHFEPLNFILPITRDDRVTTRYTEDSVIVNIDNLRESDSGNYTCNLSHNIDHFVTSKPKKKIIILTVQPKGISSNCGQHSFHCEKNRCIAARYKCDGVPDCFNRKDEDPKECGNNACFGKLNCEDGRCLSPRFCCRDYPKSSLNCTIIPTIRCCRQLIHPANLDQDLYFLASRQPKDNVVTSEFPAFNHGYVGVCGTITLVTLLMFLVMKLYIFKYLEKRRPRRNNNSNRNLIHASFSSTDSSHNRNPSNEPYSIGNHSLAILPTQAAYGEREDSAFQSDPPPSYSQVIGAPPPPYSSHENLLISAIRTTRDTVNLYHNNNNGDINGNSTVPEDQNLTSLPEPPHTGQSSVTYTLGQSRVSPAATSSVEDSSSQDK